MKFDAFATNARSYAVCVLNGNRQGKTVVLVRCDRSDLADNNRGAALASKIVEMLNALSEDEVVSLILGAPLRAARLGSSRRGGSS
jgi:hypothetical protein